MKKLRVADRFSQLNSLPSKVNMQAITDNSLYTENHP